MTKTQPIAFSALAIAASVTITGCREPDDASRSDDATPVVGRLRTVTGTIDLTVDSFADRPGYVRVPTNTVAEVMADVIVQRPTAAGTDPQRGNLPVNAPSRP